jgi:hypothetical protein
MSQFYQGTVAGSLPPVVPTSFLLDDGNSAVPAANVIRVNGASGVDTSLGASNEIIINVVTDGMPWLDKSVDFNADVQTGYFCSGTITASLPASAGLVNGATIIIYVDSGSVVTVLANAGQTIQISNAQSSAAGTAKSTAEGSVITLVYRIADTEWHSISVEGTWTLA